MAEKEVATSDVQVELKSRDVWLKVYLAGLEKYQSDPYSVVQPNKDMFEVLADVADDAARRFRNHFGCS